MPIRELRITEWSGGESESEFSGQKGSCMSVIGLDIFSEPGAVKLSTRLAKEVTGPTELCKYACADRFNNTYWFSSVSGKIWVRDKNGVWTQPYTIPTCNYVNGCGTSLKTSSNLEYIYFSYNKSSDSYDHLCYKLALSSGGLANWSDVQLDWKQLVQNFFDASTHPMVKQQGFLIIGNFNYVATVSVDIADAGASFTYNGTPDVTLPAFAYNYEVSALSRLGDDVLIGASQLGINYTYSIQDYSFAYLSRWDLTSDGFISSVPVRDNGVYNIQECEYGAYVFAGTNGSIYTFDGTNLSSPKNIRPDYTLWDTANGGCLINPQSVCSFGKYMLIGVSKNSLFGETFDEGVYCLGHKVSSYPLSLTLQYPEPAYDLSVAGFDTSMIANVDGTMCSVNSVGYAQSFAALQSIVLTQCKFNLKKVGSPTGNMVANLYEISGSYGTTSIPTGAAEATSTAIDASTLTTKYGLTTFVFSTPFSLVNGHQYAISLKYSGGDISNYIKISYDTQGNHAGNLATLSGVTWTANGSFDLMFEIGGTPDYQYSTSGLSIGAMVSIGNQVLVSYKDNTNYSTYGAQGVASIDPLTRNPYGNLVVNVMGDQDRNKTFMEWALNYRVDTNDKLSLYIIYPNFVYFDLGILPTNLRDHNYNKVYSLDKLIASTAQINILFEGDPTSYDTPVLTSLFVKFNEEDKL